MESNSTKWSDLTFGHLIRLLRELALLLVLGFVVVKLLTGEFGLDFTKLSASELVSILLAFFSIALSAAFYFAATNQSNQFYDNVNNFSKDTSELLGRLDEQVKGLGGRQTELKDSLDRYYQGTSKNKSEEAKDVTEKKAQQVEGDLSRLVTEILDKTSLSEPEREEYQKKLQERDAELATLRERLARFDSEKEMRIRRYTRRKIEKLGLSKALDYKSKELLFQLAQEGPGAYKGDLASLGYISQQKLASPNDITDNGIKMIELELERLVDSESESQQ